MKILQISAALFFLTMGTLPGTSLAQQQSFALAVGGFAGTNHAAGSAICRLNNQLALPGKSNCLVIPSKGSVDNLTKLREGELKIGIATPETIAAAYSGTGAFQRAGANKDLKTLFSLNPSFMLLVVSKDSSINKVKDVQTKRVFAAAGSSSVLLLESVLDAFGVDRKQIELTDRSRKDLSAALCKGEIEVFFAYSGGGGKYLNDALACGARFVPVAGPEAEQVVKNIPTLKIVTVPAETYKGQKEDIKTISGLATLVSTSRLTESEAYALVKGTFDNFELFRKSHPSFENLDPKAMVREGLGAPLHEGAQRYLKEKGLI